MRLNPLENDPEEAVLRGLFYQMSKRVFTRAQRFVIIRNGGKFLCACVISVKWKMNCERGELS